MPHFHLHDTLRGTLCQGLIDRASFYSILRDINKEAMDAAMTDPKGNIYNDGTVHDRKKGKKKKKKKGGGSGQLLQQQGGQSSDASSDGVGNNNKGDIVISDDGKVHVHPNIDEERQSLLVIACMSGEQNPNEPSLIVDQAASRQQMPCTTTTTSSSSSDNNTPVIKPPSLGAALLDEEWWLMSAIASRTPEEVSMNQSTKLLPTFFEAMGEKDACSVANDSTGAYSAGASSRTQLWKPGRSWWEAKSGKNPWVEPVVHNNRWR